MHTPLNLTTKVNFLYHNRGGTLSGAGSKLNIGSGRQEATRGPINGGNNILL